MSANQRLFIGNLPPQINEETLRDIFFQRTGVLPQNTFLRPNFALVRLPETLTLEKATEMLNEQLEFDVNTTNMLMVKLDMGN
ncbi:hypothetical protein TNIN_325101 [Trichonephila inaurata madagascariensis]|uniref:RRM domain-containing protein n=1 Tax=Trichonephila inaurata madagascariensis TaxID=2747483 RepID=A0A8X6XKU1_9ARAC|nr:hypothetical protein TNIN_325101 [Trichonephila inaurata madagascariensis]